MVNCGEFLQHTFSNWGGEFLQHTLSNFDSRLQYLINELSQRKLEGEFLQHTLSNWDSE